MTEQNDIFGRSRTSFLAEMQMQMAYAPRRWTEPASLHHHRMAAHWVEQALDLGRPPYREAPGFSPNDPHRTAGHEKPYGPLSRVFWRYVWKAMKSEMRAAWHDARGDEVERVEHKNTFAVTLGITG